jgi:hypothetical protein
VQFESEQQKALFKTLLAAFDTVPVSGSLAEVAAFADQVREARSAVDAAGVQVDPVLDGLSDR